MRLLVWFRHQMNFVKTVIFTLIGKTGLSPGQFDDLQNLGEPLPALAVGHAIGLVGSRKATAADAENQTATADLIDGRSFFGHPQRMA